MTERPNLEGWQTNRELWGEAWTSEYNPDLKPVLKELLQTMDATGRLGNVIVDVGAGHWPITDGLPKRPERRLINVDVGQPDRVWENGQELNLRFDANEFPQSSVARGRLLHRIGQFLKLGDLRSTEPTQVDTFILAAVLNYLDYQPVLRELDRYLKPGGRMIIVNHPDYGLIDAFSPDRPHSNDEVEQYLSRTGYEAEPLEGRASDYAYMIMVLRKRFSETAW